ncbi:MAG: pilus assembly protein [Aquiluna sp.]|nr:pilus assembly protein [Aquiluna sp.]MCF8546217.1 pilus assembly protein [Aquiluna sp.]
MFAAASGKGTKGASAVEFALVVPLLLLIVLFMIDAGRALFIQASLQNSASQAANALASGASPLQAEAIGQDTGASALAISASEQEAVLITFIESCPEIFDPEALASAVVSASVDFVFFTPIALIQRFDPGATDPGVIEITLQAQWLCEG